MSVVVAVVVVVYGRSLMVSFGVVRRFFGCFLGGLGKEWGVGGGWGGIFCILEGILGVS